MPIWRGYAGCRQNLVHQGRLRDFEAGSQISRDPDYKVGLESLSGSPYLLAVAVDDSNVVACFLS